MANGFSQKDALGAFFGFGLWAMGLATSILGVWGIYTQNHYIGALLVFGGQAVSLLGAAFASMPAEPKGEVPLVGNYLYGLCFVASVFILIIGLAEIFTVTLPSLYLMGVALSSAAISAWSVVRQNRPG
ncbi:MAG: hypothetical protein HZB51_10525 [Chloroflexi bacterium]|nr:hypothetical protein [Chloroflexota bacterium]